MDVTSAFAVLVLVKALIHSNLQNKSSMGQTLDNFGPGPKLGGALKDLFQNGGGKKYIKPTKSGQGEVLRPEIER